MLPPRELVLRERVELPREDFAAPLPERLAVEPVPEVLRLVPVLAVFARLEGDFFAVLVERELFAVPLAERFAAVDRVPVDDLREALDRPALPRDDEADEPELPLLLADPSIDHLPDITRWAASATASAMSEPSLVALETTLLAACDALSAASRPASRIFLRAAGLAASAAAAAVSPAASISLLIAAFASLSTVLSPEPERDDDALEREPEELAFGELEREELLRVDLAIAYLPASRERHSRAVPVP